MARQGAFLFFFPLSFDVSKYACCVVPAGGVLCHVLPEPYPSDRGIASLCVAGDFILLLTNKKKHIIYSQYTNNTSSYKRSSLSNPGPQQVPFQPTFVQSSEERRDSIMVLCSPKRRQDFSESALVGIYICKIKNPSPSPTSQHKRKKKKKKSQNRRCRENTKCLAFGDTHSPSRSMHKRPQTIHLHHHLLKKKKKKKKPPL